MSTPSQSPSTTPPKTETEAQIEEAISVCLAQEQFRSRIRQLGITEVLVAETLRKRIQNPSEARTPMEIAMALANNLIEIHRNPDIQTVLLDTLIDQ